jgi:resuscitation-promoting factor RpfB
VRTRSRGKTVGDALAELGIMVDGSDRVTPTMDTPLTDNTAIRLVRVVNTVNVERVSIPYQAIMVPDDELEIDQQRLDQGGENGEFRRRYNLISEDGVETERRLTDAWVAAEPITQVTSYGRKIVPRTIDTPSGAVTYWRKVRMFATAYSKSTAGVSRELSYFGITRSGLPMARGIVAIDPTVIPWRSRVYVPGYGIGLAADTGGAIRARRIDLGYDDNNLQSWYGWVDVYLLDSPPYFASIRWILPNWPPKK